MNHIRLWESRNLNVYGYMCLQVYLVPIPYDSKCVTVFVSIPVSVSVIVSVPSSLADHQWYLVSNTQYVVSLEKSGKDSYDSKWTFQSVSSTGNHRRPVNPKQPRETQATRQAVNPE